MRISHFKENLRTTLERFSTRNGKNLKVSSFELSCIERPFMKTQVSTYCCAIRPESLPLVKLWDRICEVRSVKKELRDKLLPVLGCTENWIMHLTSKTIYPSWSE